MGSSNFSREDLANYYDLIYSYKDYQKEVEEIYSLIKEFKKCEGNMLMDVACGTAMHLRFLKDYFQCIGIDINQRMLEIATKKLPRIEFKKENMISMRLNKKFDIITCLFSAIGYVKTQKNLQKIWATFATHLKQGGVAIVEPWVTREQYHANTPHLVTYEDKNIKIARLNSAKIKGSISILDFHYLIAEKAGEVRHFQERHKMGMFDIDETLKIMECSGFEAQFFPNKLMTGRGVYVGIKM